MMCGKETIDLDILRRHTIFGDKCDPKAKHIKYFWKVLKSFTQEELKRFISFTYAQRRLPSTDEEWKTSRTAQLRIKMYRFPEPVKIDPRRQRRRLARSSQTPKVIIMTKKSFQEKMDQQLPTAQTCFFDLYLPSYSSEKIMRERLLLAISLESFDNSEQDSLGVDAEETKEEETKEEAKEETKEETKGDETKRSSSSSGPPKRSLLRKSSKARRRTGQAEV